jgi:CRISPR/Cas system CSM-associated protein Csm4 (group 5 of RAMP superfamily)
LIGVKVARQKKLTRWQQMKADLEGSLNIIQTYRHTNDRLMESIREQDRKHEANLREVRATRVLNDDSIMAIKDMVTAQAKLTMALADSINNLNSGSKK